MKRVDFECQSKAALSALRTADGLGRLAAYPIILNGVESIVIGHVKQRTPTLDMGPLVVVVTDEVFAMFGEYVELED